MRSNAGESRAESPARTTICPIALGTSPRAIAAKGGPTGAPGQTARMRNPTDTIGLVSKEYKRAIVASGTSTKLATTLSTIGRGFRTDATTSPNLTFSPIDSMTATRPATVKALTRVARVMVVSAVQCTSGTNLYG